MNFEQEIRQLQHPEPLNLRHHDCRVVRIHEQRTAHVDIRLANITYKLGRMGGFRGPQ